MPSRQLRQHRAARPAMKVSAVRRLERPCCPTPQTGEAKIRGDLGQKFVDRKPDRYRHADSAPNARDQSR